MLPSQVRVTAVAHPLFGQLLEASSFKRWDGALLLMVELPDGTPGTIPADATNVFGERAAAEPLGVTVLSAEGLGRLRHLVAAHQHRSPSRIRHQTRK